MQLINRWGAAPPTDAAPSPVKPALPSAEPPSAGAATPAVARPVIGGVGLGTSLGQIQARKDIALSLDADGNPCGEETFTFTYGLRQLDGDVVFGLWGDTVSSITVTHTLSSTNCADSATAAMIVNQQIRDRGAPLRRVVPAAAGGTGGETASYTFRRNNTDVVLVLQTSSSQGDASICRVSMNYQRSVGPGYPHCRASRHLPGGVTIEGLNSFCSTMNSL
jgi:hypothetical protein